MLNAANEEGQGTEAQKVLNQIHDYMDMHHDRFGYVITETEVIMFKRREENELWGQLNLSPAIPLHGPVGELNGLMILWYFHVKIRSHE